MYKRKIGEVDVLSSTRSSKAVRTGISGNPEGIFEQLMKKSCYTLGYDGKSNELEVDQAVFQRNLCKLLRTHESFPEVIQEFVEGLQKHLEDLKRLQVSLVPTATSVNCKSARDVCQDSLIHLLLGIEILQEDVSFMLIEKTAELAECDEADIFDRKNNQSVPRMILSQFRWLNKLVNSERLSSQMLDLIKAMPVVVQKDIISLLPDIISDCDHPKVACSLSEILLEDKSLSVAILDTLSNLNISSETLSQVRKQVLKTLSSVDIQDLPVVVKFVLQNLGQQDALETINKLRNHLDLTSSFDPVSTSTPFRKSGNPESRKEISVRIVNAIKLALRFQKSLCDSWIKVIESLTTPDDHRCLDFVVLLIIHSLGAYKRNVETLFRSKIKCGDLNEDLLQITFRYLIEILKDYLPTLMVLSEILLRSYEPVISQYGSLLYQKSFVSFDTCNRQEIIGNLVTNVGNGPMHEVDAALNTLLTLVEQHPEKMVRFGLFIKNILDHLDSLSLGQIRKVYSVLSVLAYRGGHEGSLLRDDMFIIIRKQLFNNNSRYHKMGVIGALMASRYASNRSEDAESASLISSESLREDNCEQATSLLELVLKSTSQSPEGLALFCDELFRIVRGRQLGKNVEEWITEKTISDFQKLYTYDIDEETIRRLDSEKEFKYGLDEVTRNPVALNLQPLLNNWIKNSNTGTKGSFCADKLMSPITISPYFRLLRICQQYQSSSTLESIDTLLGCPIYLPLFQEERFDTLPIKDKHLKLNMLFFLINWFRELINAFAPVEDQVVRFKVCQRLKLLVELQDLLFRHMQEISNFEPPKAIFDCDDTSTDQKKAGSASTSQKPPGKKSNGKCKPLKKVLGRAGQKDSLLSQSTQDNNVTTQKSTQLENNSQKNSDDKGNKKIPSVSSGNSLQTYLRELDMEVFVLLQLKMDLKTSAYTNSLEDNLTLGPPEMKFLLEDLINKLQHCLASSSSALGKMRMKSVGFSNLEMNTAAEVAAFTVKLLPAFCHILEDCSGYYQSIILQQSDSVIDPLGIVSEESQYIFSCMQHVLQSVTILLSWKGFGSSVYLPYLKEAMQTLGTRLEKLPQNTGLENLIKHTLQYLCKFKDSIMLLLNATALIKLIESVTKYSKTDAQKRSLSQLAEDFLQHEWPELISNKMKASQLNEQIQILLEVYIRYSGNIIETLEYLATEAITHLMDTESSSGDVKFKTLNKNTFSCYYKIMLNFLVENMKIYYSSDIANENEEFVQWTKAVEVFHRLVNLIKVFDGKSNLNACLKFGRHFIEMFLRHGMPLIDKLFLMKRDDCFSILKTIQMSTRFLQHVCSHSKVLKDIALTNQVPPVKKTLESFVYRVKAMLALNKCGEAFWLGNLKNRDLKGEEILSQSSNQSDHESSGDDEMVGDGDAEAENCSRSSQNEASDGSEEF